MTKVRKNVSIDADLAEIVDERDEFNLSGFVNRCLEQHFAATGATNPEEAVIRAEIEELEQQIDEIDGELSRKRDRRNQLEEKLEQTGGQEPELLGQAREKLRGTPRDPDNPAIQNWAAKLGISADQLIQELNQ